MVRRITQHIDVLIHAALHCMTNHRSPIAFVDTRNFANPSRFHRRNDVACVHFGHFPINTDSHVVRIDFDIATAELGADPVNHPAVVIVPAFLKQPLL